VNEAIQVRRLCSILAAGSFAFLCFAVRSSFPVAAQLSTQDHLAEPGWWPTQPSRSLNDYLGSSSCGKCHKQKAKEQPDTPMGRTLEHAENAEVLQASEPLSFRNGKYVYRILRERGRPIVSVTDGAETISAPLQWAFGTSEVSQSYLFEREGKYFESRVSYFSSLQNLHFTPTRALLAPHSLQEALARPVEIEEVKRCFACHSTASVIGEKFAPAKLMAGVTCEACHGPGEKHAEAMEASIIQGGTGDDEGGRLIFDPAKLSPADSVDFCGACHGTWWDVKLTHVIGISNVRAQPYRLQSSKCWGKGDARITCMACHDPHVPLVKEPAAYDEKCLNCHTSTVGAKTTRDHPGAACPIAKNNCVTCHMPKIEVPNMHYAFADHLIRIVRPGEPLPE